MLTRVLGEPRRSGGVQGSDWRPSTASLACGLPLIKKPFTHAALLAKVREVMTSAPPRREGVSGVPGKPG